MRRTWIVLGAALVGIAAGAAAYQHSLHWKQYRYAGTRLMADLGHPDAVIRTASLARLPRDLLKAPIARDVLTEDLVFYYEQHEDRMGLSGAIKRIAYEHKLGWTDLILAGVLDEPAEVALWRDGKSALRHYALVIRRNMLSRIVEEAAAVAGKDSQLSLAGEIDTGRGKARVYALEVNPRRTFLFVADGDRMVVLSNPGLLFDRDNQAVPEARAAIVEWLNDEGVLSKRFALDDAATASPDKPAHTLALGAPAMALGYGVFIPGFKGMRLDFSDSWSTSLWLSPAELPKEGLGDARLWGAAPANPSACVALPVDWKATQTVIDEADNRPAVPDAAFLNALHGPALACWYHESSLYSPVFIARLPDSGSRRDAVLKALSSWAITNTDEAAPLMAARGEYVAFSPDPALVTLVTDTIARTNPSVADQTPATNATVALLTPRSMSSMFEKEAFAALADSSDANLLSAAREQLPARMKALATYPPYRLELAGQVVNGWQRVEWRASGNPK